MEAQRIGGAGMAFGCVRLGSVSGGRSWREDVELVREAIDLGVTTFDTADSYGNGVSELVLGRAIRGRRADLCIATKSGYRFSERSLAAHTVRRVGHRVLRRGRPAAPSATGGSRGTYGAQDFAPDSLRIAVDASLRRLGTDYIDVFQLHGPKGADASMVDSVMAVVGDLVQAGKVRRFGIGAESVEVAAEWMRAADVGAVQVPYGMLDPQAAEAVLPFAADRGVEVWVRGVFGGGVLSASRESEFVRGHPKHTLIDDVHAIADDLGVSVFQLALDFVRARPEITTILLGIHSREHLGENLAFFDRPAVDQAAIDRVQRTASRWWAEHEHEAV